MYVPENDKRKYFVTVREVKEDGVLGTSQSFSIKESETKLNRQQIVDLLKDAINSTHKGKK